MKNQQCVVGGADPYERVDFEASLIGGVDPATQQQGTPSVTLCTNTGARLKLVMGGKSSDYKVLAAWAAEVAADLEVQGR